MLQKMMAAMKWIAEKPEGLLGGFGEDYARELLAAHGLLEIEADHLRRNRREREEKESND